ncbi:DUF692 domain-containing protein [Dyella nitratireducens]|uniref:UPF0276 protein GCM10010981_13150 n=1 Tax=Dyella nitratireducens TaxID=1849580 RepID=A0ABQ1FQ05_9GAMM|nr:DUF692 domain-containing protein [Dyella nitratireducens]GGA25903.1 UPF0276 protein [Dyella nitratireducens]GLQ43621.1 UPF0276 protein [Dyella nitratireducens]
MAMHATERSDAMPYLGYGLGLRVEHYETLLAQPTGIEWLEIVSENYMVHGGLPLVWLERFRERFPLVMHGVSMSIGSTDPLDDDYLARLAALARRIEPAWVSDHLCWTGVQGVNLHDLMPLPYTEEALDHVVARVKQVQDRLKRRILLENVSSYVSFADSQLTEWEFLAAVAERADCLILLDINNVHVSAMNHGFSALDYLHGIPVSRVQQFHLAGYEQGERLIIDTHDAPVSNAVWDLYIKAVRRFGRVSTMIERDDHFPPLSELIAELEHARSLAKPLLRDAA